MTDLKRAAPVLEESSAALTGGSRSSTRCSTRSGSPRGRAEGYLFYLSWLNHNTNGAFLTETGLGPLRRGLFMYTCFTSQLADNTLASRPALRTAREITRLPTTPEICPPIAGFPPITPP